MEHSVSDILRRHYSRIALACFVFLAAALAAQFVAALLVQLFMPSLMQTGWFLTGLSFACLYAVGFPLFLLILPRAPEQLPE